MLSMLKATKTAMIRLCIVSPPSVDNSFGLSLLFPYHRSGRQAVTSEHDFALITVPRVRMTTG
jgi:hypothetical protein